MEKKEESTKQSKETSTWDVADMNKGEGIVARYKGCMIYEGK